MPKLKQKRRYNARLRELDKQAELLKLEKRVQDKEIELGLKKPRKSPSWSKRMMIVMYAICIEIVIYAEIAMWCKQDMTALYALIGVPAAMFGTFWAYAEKSKAENTKGGIAYDMAIRQENAESAPPEPEPEPINQQSTDDDEIVG